MLTLIGIKTWRRTIHSLCWSLPVRTEPFTPNENARQPQMADTRTLSQQCPCCGGPMIIVETFERGQTPRSRAPPVGRAA